MSNIRFEWDEAKNLANQRKHGVSFEAATLIFSDPHVVSRLDRIVDHEERWQSIGLVRGHHLLLVAHTIWEEDDFGELIEVIRIISARDVDRKERLGYESARHQNRQV